jgi:hypothetical protein
MEFTLFTALVFQGVIGGLIILIGLQRMRAIKLPATIVRVLWIVTGGLFLSLLPGVLFP